MILTIYQNAVDFLSETQPVFEKNEAANNLMLGICFRLRQFPENIDTAPYLATVTNAQGIIFIAVLSKPQRLIVYSDQLECREAMELIIRDLLAKGRIISRVLGPSRVAETFAATWARIAGALHKPGMGMRIYELGKVIPPQTSRGALRLAAEADLELVARWILAFENEALNGGEIAEARETAKAKIAAGDIYIWEDLQPVAMAAKTRPTTNGICINLVYTPPELRGRGHASACVAALSQRLLDSGYKFCCLFTDRSNLTSNHIYQSIGYTPVADFNEFVFD